MVHSRRVMVARARPRVSTSRAKHSMSGRLAWNRRRRCWWHQLAQVRFVGFTGQAADGGLLRWSGRTVKLPADGAVWPGVCPRSGSVLDQVPEVDAAMVVAGLGVADGQHGAIGGNANCPEAVSLITGCDC